MAELATPSAAAIFDGSAAPDKKAPVKPEKPDEESYKAALKKAEKEHADSMARFNAIREKVDKAQPKNKDSPSAKRRTELTDQLKEIRDQQKGSKNNRTKIFDDIKRQDEKLKSQIAEQKLQRSKTPFKNVAEVDSQINNLEKQVNGGMMKLVDEKKALAEISSLRKQKKGFAGFDDQQKKIDETKAALASLRATLDDPQSKALSEKYNTLQSELDTIKAEQDDAFKNIKSLRDQRDKLHAEQQEKYLAIKGIKDKYYQDGRAFQKWEYEARQKARERRKAEQESYEKEKKKERAQKMLAEASDKAYLDEIRRAESLLRFLDPSFKKENAPLQAPSGFEAKASRTVDDTELKGMKVKRKDEEEDYFKGTGGKKGKKGRKTADGGVATPPAAGKYSCPPSVMEDCGFMGIDPPMSAADIPEVREKVKAKLDHWKADQSAQTERNIAKAKKEVERLDAEDVAAGTTPVNGDSKAATTSAEDGTIAKEVELVKSAVADVVADLTGTKLDDKTS